MRCSYTAGAWHEAFTDEQGDAVFLALPTGRARVSAGETVLELRVAPGHNEATLALPQAFGEIPRFGFAKR